MVACMVPSACSACSESRLQWNHTITDRCVLPEISQVEFHFTVKFQLILDHYPVWKSVLFSKFSPKPHSGMWLHKDCHPYVKKLELNMKLLWGCSRRKDISVLSLCWTMHGASPTCQARHSYLCNIGMTVWGKLIASLLDLTPVS